MISLLIDDYPLLVSPKLARAIGLNQAIAFQHVASEIVDNGQEKDGQRWLKATQVELQAQLPFWDINTLRRTLGKLESLGFLVCTTRYNAVKTDQTKWYAVPPLALSQALLARR